MCFCFDFDLLVYAEPAVPAVALPDRPLQELQGPGVRDLQPHQGQPCASPFAGSDGPLRIGSGRRSTAAATSGRPVCAGDQSRAELGPAAAGRVAVRGSSDVVRRVDLSRRASRHAVGSSSSSNRGRDQQGFASNDGHELASVPRDEPAAHVHARAAGELHPQPA